MQILARVGPWPVISRLVAYNGRLWFANSVKWRNHNSADIWSFDPVLHTVRFERNLYSQDAGIPLVYKGLLYWPYEDSRHSVGWGMAEVTDGKNWRSLVIPTAEIYHTNVLMAWHDKLLAITSAWRLGLQVSENNGIDWHRLYDHPTAKGRLSRLYDPLIINGDLYGQLQDAGETGLVRFTGTDFESVPGWPKNHRFFAVTVHKGKILAAVNINGKDQIWQTDGRRSALLGDQLAKTSLVDMASDGTRFWAVSNKTGQSHIWSSIDGIDWQQGASLSGGRPLSIEVIASKVYVAGAGDDGRGILWGPSRSAIARIATLPPLPEQFPQSADKQNWQQTAALLDAKLADVTQYAHHGREGLRPMVFDIVKRGPPPGFFADRLNAPMPRETIGAFGGQLQIRAADLGQSILLWAMGLARRPEVPVEILKSSWNEPANTFEKYFNPLPVAIWAVAVSGQKDRITLDALIKRLDFTDDPLWLRIQVAGALTAVTGKPFAHDFSAWQDWWAKQP